MGNIDEQAVENKARWVRTSTEMYEHDFFGDEPYDQRSAWGWMIAAAAWKKRRVRHKGKMIDLERGQLLAGRDFLAKQFHWGEKKVRNFLDRLAAEKMIEKGQSNGHYANVITICNYDRYQSVDKSEGQSKGQSGASVGPERGQTLTKDTKVTITADDARARKIDPAELYDKLVEAANGSLNPMAAKMGMIAVSDPIGWLNAGADLELDVLPAVRELGHKAAKGTVQSWRYFAPKVSELKARREAGLPEVHVPQAAPFEDWRAKRQREAEEALRVVRSMQS
jgi:hypothetical protein